MVTRIFELFQIRLSGTLPMSHHSEQINCREVSATIILDTGFKNLFDKQIEKQFTDIYIKQ